MFVHIYSVKIIQKIWHIILLLEPGFIRGQKLNEHKKVDVLSIHCEHTKGEPTLTSSLLGSRHRSVKELILGVDKM